MAMTAPIDPTSTCSELSAAVGSDDAGGPLRRR